MKHLASCVVLFLCISTSSLVLGENDEFGSECSTIQYYFLSGKPNQGTTILLDRISFDKLKQMITFSYSLGAKQKFKFIGKRWANRSPYQVTYQYSEDGLMIELYEELGDEKEVEIAFLGKDVLGHLAITLPQFFRAEVLRTIFCVRADLVPGMEICPNIISHVKDIEKTYGFVAWKTLGPSSPNVQTAAKNASKNACTNAIYLAGVTAKNLAVSQLASKTCPEPAHSIENCRCMKVGIGTATLENSPTCDPDKDCDSGWEWPPISSPEALNACMSGKVCKDAPSPIDCCKKLLATPPSGSSPFLVWATCTAKDAGAKGEQACDPVCEKIPR